MDMSSEFYDMICSDISRLGSSNQLSNDEKFMLFREMDGRYQACIQNWFSGMWYANGSLTRIRYEDITPFDPHYTQHIQDNLNLVKAKLETFKHQMNSVSHPQAPTNQVNVTTNLTLNVTCEQARSHVEAMDSLTNEQTREVLEKIDTIEKILQSSKSKKSKWESVKPILAWLADKSYDLGKTILPLLLKISE